MEKIHVNIHDKNFIHSINEDGFDTASAGLEPTKLQWVRGLYKWEGVTVFTDYYLTDPVVDLVESKHKVAWLVEPKSFSQATEAIQLTNGARHLLISVDMPY